METLFSHSGTVSPDVLARFSALISHEFYQHKLSFENGVSGELRFEKARSHPISLTHLRSDLEISTERSWAHIRNNKVGSWLILLDLRGSVTIERSRGTITIEEGQGAIVNSNEPFRIRRLPHGTGEVCETFCALVPSDIFLSHIRSADQFDTPFVMESVEGHIVQSLLDVLVKHADQLRPEVARPLTASLLEAVAGCFDCRETASRTGRSHIDRRLVEIENYIFMNATDPDLSYRKVAESCNISQRSLGYLLKANNSTFSRLLWKIRLQKAHDWLSSPSSRDHSVSSTAYMSGFKSTSHFSRLFKAEYGYSPREYRRTLGSDNDYVRPR
jgi:AraC family transcriptional activator of tynA and feaB